MTSSMVYKICYYAKYVSFICHIHQMSLFASYHSAHQDASNKLSCVVVVPENQRSYETFQFQFDSERLELYDRFSVRIIELLSANLQVHGELSITCTSLT